jgi:hypothetical protein
VTALALAVDEDHELHRRGDLLLAAAGRHTHANQRGVGPDVDALTPDDLEVGARRRPSGLR